MKKLVGLLVVGLIVVYGVPKMNWGRVTMQPGEIVTVSGEAKRLETNQMASFTAGVESVNDNKDVAIKEVNDKVAVLIEAVKNFGIKSDDIKTQSLSIYQSEESYYDKGIQKSRKGQWRVSNSVEITLREVAKVSELTGLLTDSGANNVYGPNFRMDDQSNLETALFEKAMKNAREKAELLAKASGRKLGKVMSVTEGNGTVVSPLFNVAKDGMGGGGAPVEPGSTTVSKSVTVVWELR